MEEKPPRKIVPIHVVDRNSRKVFSEKVFGHKALGLLYGGGVLSTFLREPLARCPLVSILVGLWQRMPWTKRKIVPFIQDFGVDTSEFVKKTTEFCSFNDFFVRKLRPGVRQIEKSEAVIPADGRYRFYPCLAEAPNFRVKGENHSLQSLLRDEKLAKEFEGGAAAFGRLCPVDYHRFHFPCDCMPGIPKLINGWLYSVNPVALQWNTSIFLENKRVITELWSKTFGKILFVEVGATCVGSIHQTFELGANQKKGSEKGYFSFGGSALILLFQKGAIQFDEDLLGNESEIYCQIGQSMGREALVSASHLREKP